MSEVTLKTHVEHKYFEYGRWFLGYGASMDPHTCTENSKCQWRVVETITIRHEWQDEKPTVE